MSKYPKMSRAHLELIARAIMLSRPTSPAWPEEIRTALNAQADNIAFRIANELEHTNNNFNRERFMRACGDRAYWGMPEEMPS